MSIVGYYRYKTTANAEKSVSFLVNNIVVSIKDIIPIQECGDYKLLKYLDKNGHYRFYPFNEYYQTLDTPDQIGTVNKFITNILDDQSNTQNVGFRNNRRIDLTADVPTEQLEKLTDIYTSPRVYLYIGESNSDTPQDWLEVEIETLTPIVKRRKGQTGRIDITVILPENFTIKMI